MYANKTITQAPNRQQNNNRNHQYEEMHCLWRSISVVMSGSKVETFSSCQNFLSAGGLFHIIRSVSVENMSFYCLLLGTTVGALEQCHQIHAQNNVRTKKGVLLLGHLVTTLRIKDSIKHSVPITETLYNCAKLI